MLLKDKAVRNFFRDKVILITGAAGSVGQELIRLLLTCAPNEIRAVDNNETALFLLGERHRHTDGLTFYFGDVRDARKMENLCAGVEIIFHAAALKHVGLSEYNPFDAVQTNILGVKNIIQAAICHKVKRIIFTSSDKAVNPTNVMGTSKLMGERLMTAANIVNANARQVFSSVRFGNVIASQGSVVPIFADQIRRGASVTVTDINMTRFFMTLQEAAFLVLEACTLACGGEVFVTKMPVMRILDLAQAMIDLLAPVYGFDPREVGIQFIGARSGEKLYEELLNDEEIGRTTELKKMFVILPALRNFYTKIKFAYKDAGARPASRSYISSREEPMTVAEIKNYLYRHKVLSEFLPSFPEAAVAPENVFPGRLAELAAAH